MMRHRPDRVRRPLAGPVVRRGDPHGGAHAAHGLPVPAHAAARLRRTHGHPSHATHIHTHPLYTKVLGFFPLAELDMELPKSSYAASCSRDSVIPTGQLFQWP